MKNKFNFVLGIVLLSSVDMAAVNANCLEVIATVEQDSVAIESSQEVDDDTIVVKPDQMPEFPGGLTALLKYLRSEISYPKKAADKRIQGRVIVEFVVDRDGKVGECKVLRRVHSLLDREAVRVIKSMPRWKPGIQKGKAVRVKYTLPINFQLPNGGAKTKISTRKPLFTGDKDLQAFFRKHAEYPTEAKEQGVHGLVVAEYVVSETGDVTEVNLIKSAAPLLDNEVRRVIDLMPQWQPGLKNGKPVRVKYVQSFLFQLKGVSSHEIDELIEDSLSNVYTTEIPKIKIKAE